MTVTTSPDPVSTDTFASTSRDRSAAVAGICAILFGGAIFGFFYAWVCSTMWGLDQADPRVAIEAMQEMNRSVRNQVFFPAFFLTPAVMLVAAWLSWRARAGVAAWSFVVAAVIYAVGGLALTATVNVPMNEELGRVIVPESVEQARVIWDDYSGRWQFFNQVRTVASGSALMVAAFGLWSLGRREARGLRRMGW